MVVELAFILSFTIHIRHLFQGIKHALDDFLVGFINACPYLETIRTNELDFNFANIDREVFDKWSHTLALFASQFSLFDPFNLVILRTFKQNNATTMVTEGLRHDDRIDLSAAYVASQAD